MNSYSNKILQEWQLKDPCPNSHFYGKTEINNCPTPLNQIIPKKTLPNPIWDNNDQHDDHHQQQIPYFTITPQTLSNILQHNTTTSSDSLQQSPPRINEIVAALKSNIQSGIDGNEKDLYLRHQAFGSNHNYQENCPIQPKCLKRLLLDAFKDTNIILLLCCAMLSLLIGIKRNGPQEGFFDGAIIFLAIFIVVNFAAIIRFYKARRNVIKKVVFGVIRRGRVHHIPVSEIVVGDVVILKTGDLIPADGFYVDGTSFELDNGSIQEGLEFSKCPSIFSGGKVVKGECQMLVTSVGKNTERSKLMRSISTHQSDDQSKLQIGIDKMNNKVEKIWLCMSLLVLVVQVLRCFVFNSDCDENHDLDPKGVKNTVEEIMNEATKVMKKKGGVGANGLVGMLCILIFSIRDGLPLGILIILAFASKKMKSHKAMVLNLPACATTGLVTTICAGKTSDLILQPLKMAELWIGLDSIDEFYNGKVDFEVLYRLREAVCMSASDPVDDVLLWWAKKVGLGSDLEELKKNCTILPNEGFDVNKNRKLLKRNGEVGNIVHVHWKGEPEMVLSMCSHHYNVDGTMRALDEDKRMALQQIISQTTISSHRFAFAYKQVVIEEDEQGKETLKPMEDGLTWLGLLGFKNPYEPRVREAIEECAKLGKKIKLVVGDDIISAKLKGIYSGILKPEDDHIKGAVIEALEFRNSTQEDRLSMIDNVQVIASATPFDRLLMVQCLKQKGEAVAVIGTSIRDSPSLKEADVGIFSCDNSANLTKENGDIIVSGSNFETVSEIFKLGRCVCKTLEKFLQLQLTLNIVAFALNFIVVVSTSEVPLSPFQLLWVNLIINALGALALAASVVEPPSGSEPPVYGEGPIITKAMWRNIGVQSFYQVTMLLILFLKGENICQVDETVLKVMVFNCYVLCQVSVLINAREIEKANVFEGILKNNNYWFLVIVGAIIVLQEVVIEIVAIVAHTGRLDLKEWCICIGIAGVSLPIDWVSKWVFLKTY
ncbi:hypothetical protein LguiB_003178 [Lonicera macranthoides]